MSKQEVLADFQIEIARPFVTQMAEEQLKRVEERHEWQKQKLINSVANQLIFCTIGMWWWRKYRYTRDQAEELAEKLVMNGKLPHEGFWYSDDLHYERVELLYGALPKQMKFLRELI